MKNAILSRLVIFVASVFLLASCGGGGGDGTFSSSTGLTYDGIASAALITESNVNELSTTALSTGIVNIALSSPVRAVTASDQETESDDKIAASPSSLFVLTSLMRKVEEVALSSSGQSNDSSRAVVTVTDSIDGECGGHANFSIEVNDVTGDFSGTFDFVDYCENSEIVSGSANFSGEVDLDTEGFAYFTMDFNNIETESIVEHFTMSGSVEMYIEGDTIDLIADIIVKDNKINKTYKIEDFHVYLEEYYDYVWLEMSGRFYHPDYGYVELSTPEALEGNIYSDGPTDGQLVLTGRDLTSARLIAYDSSYYWIEMDLDGNGSYETSTDLLAW